MPIDPRLSLAVQQPKIAGPAEMAEFKNMLQRNQLNSLELQQMGQQVQGQNALRSLYAEPSNFQDGAPTDDAVRKFGAGGGDVASLRNRLLTQQTHESTVERNLAQARKVNEEADREQTKNFARAILPIGRTTLKKYEDLLKKGVSPDEATKQAQAFYLEQVGEMETSGSVSKKYVDAAKQSKFNPYAFQVRISQFSHMLGEKTDEPKSGIAKLKADLEAGRIDQKEYDAAVKKQTYIKPPTGDGSGAAPGAAGGGALPKGVVEYIDVKTNKHYGVGKGLAFELDEAGKWNKITPTSVPQKIVKVGSAAAGQGAREAVFTQRMLQAANQASKDLENVTFLPITVTSGVFGTMKPGPGMMDAGRAVLANKMTKEETQVYNAMSTGLQRTLAGIEAAGLMPSGQLTHQMEGIIFREGDTNLAKLHKLAQTRQIIESGMEVIGVNPRVSEDEKGLIKNIERNVRKAVPFTHKDLIELQKAQMANPKATLKDVMAKAKQSAKEKGVPQSPAGGGAGAKKSFSKFWSAGGSRGSPAPKNTSQAEDPDEDSDDDKE